MISLGSIPIWLRRSESGLLRAAVGDGGAEGTVELVERGEGEEEDASEDMVEEGEEAEGGQ